MIGTGVLLYFLGEFFSMVLGKPSKDPNVWDARDIPGFFGLIGLVLILLGGVVWLWRVAP